MQKGLLLQGTPLPTCKRHTTVSKPPKHKPAGLPAPASNGPLPTIGQLRSNIFTLISVRGMGAARQELASGLRSMGPPSQSAST